MQFFIDRHSFIRAGFVLSVISIFSFSSCQDNPKSTAGTKNVGVNKDSMLNFNKRMVRTEDQQIDDFASRYEWKMNKTSTGLRYMIYKKGNGEAAKRGMIATLKFTLRLLNGDLIKSSDEKGPLVFEIGHGGVESGLEEGILLLHKGDHVKFIVPSHLAFGLIGDQEKIPPGATLVYNVELINLK
jgi:FKBP-type peptidyl-prolyl cis-trans isomerase FkpA